MFAIISNAMESDHPVETCAYGSGWRWRLLFAIALLGCAAWAYRPALNRVFFADQVSYFAELQGETTLASGLRLLDYGARRQYYKGDEASYRPLLFAGLAVQNAVFQRNFRLWNAANLALHLAVAYLLFEALWRVRRTPLACGGALWFALLSSNFELVTWNHLGGYLVGYGWLLAALWAAREMGANQVRTWWYWIYGATMIGAMLEYELAVVAGFAVVAYGLWCRRHGASTGWRWVAAVGAPILVYAALYARHAYQCDRLFWVDSQGAVCSLADRLAAWPVLLGSWAQRICLPQSGQLAVSVLQRSQWQPAAAGGATASAAGVLWVGMLFFIGRGFSRKHLRAAWPFGVLLAGLIAAYAGMNLAGRPTSALQMAHYDYLPALLGTVLCYSLIDFSRVGKSGITGALTCLLLLAALNGWQVRQISGRIREMHRPLAQYLEWVEHVVRPRLSTPGYSFAIQGVPPELDLWAPLTSGYPDQGQSASTPLLRFLYGKSYDPTAPAETLAFPGWSTGYLGNRTDERRRPD